MLTVQKTKQARAHGRALTQIRDIDFSIDELGYASASVLFSQGKTKILASVTLQQGLPHFLKGQSCGWLSAEYAMLPCSTHQRNNRESSQAQRNPRSVEISRLIGRCLRTCINLAALKEKTITVDCDVLQADGGTRVASITAASIALEIATKRWFEKKITDSNIFVQRIAGISIGIINNEIMADLDFFEDSNADADFNFIITEQNQLIEVQGTSEKNPIAWDLFDAAKILAQKSTALIFDTTNKKLFSSNQKTTHASLGYNHESENRKLQSEQVNKQNPFSIGSRLAKQ